MSRLKLWWLHSQLRKHRQYQRDDIEASFVEADICRDLLARINALRPVVAAAVPPVLRVVR